MTRQGRRQPSTLSLLRNALLTASTFLLASMVSDVNAQASITPAATTSGLSNPSGGSQGLSYILSPSYAGMGIEPSNLFAFTGRSSPNQMTMNLLNILANYTGQPPHMRVGGNTGDTALFNSSYNGYDFQPNPKTTGPTDVAYYGPNFFKVINYFPKDTPVTYGLPLAYQGSGANQMLLDVANGVVDAFTNIHLYSLEVGNEPDLYVQNKFRQSGWGASQYGDEWSSAVLQVWQQVLQPKGITKSFFESACTATTAANRGFRIEDLVQTGVATATDNGLYVGGWNQHDYYYYVNVSSYKLTLEGLMDLGSTIGQFNEWSNQADQARTTGKPYFLREMGSVGPEGIQGISDTFGNALWTFNFFLFASTVGVQSVQMHMLQDSYGSPWQPIPLNDGTQPFVRPSYSAWAAMAQLNGAGCQTQIAPLTINNMPSGYTNRLGAYAAYDAGNLQSVIVINTKPAYSSQGQNINTQQVSFSLPTSMSGKTFYLSLLTAPGADALNNTQWNGYDYSQNGDGTAKRVDSQTRTAVVGSDGTLTFSVRDSQAVVANMGSQIGSTNNKPDSKACAQFAIINTQDTGSGFKATSGFASHLPLSMGAIIGIAAGGGSALLILLGLIIFCCVRRARKRRATKLSDSAALLPPAYSKGGPGAGNNDRKRPYKSVPYKDMADSSDDIFMMPVRKGDKYTDMNNMSTRGGPFRGHKHSDSYGSATPSMTNSPLLPASPSFGSRARVDSYSSENAIPPPGSAGYGTPTKNGSPKPTSRLRALPPSNAGPKGQPMYGQSNLNPNSRHGHGAEAAAAIGGAGAGMAAGYALANKMNEQGNVRRGDPRMQQQQQMNQSGPNDPWQQLAQQQHQQYLAPGNAHNGYPQQYGPDGRIRYGSTPNASAAEGALGLAGPGMMSNQQRGRQDQRHSGQLEYKPERRRSLPPNNNAQGEKRRSKPSGAASSQGHGYRSSLDQSNRPPVPDLPASIRASMGQRPQSSSADRSNPMNTNAAALAAATAATGGTAAAQHAYAAQRQQNRQSSPARRPISSSRELAPSVSEASVSASIYGGIDAPSNDHTGYGMAMTTSMPLEDSNHYSQSYIHHGHNNSAAGPALLDPNAYAMAAQPRTSSEMAFYNQVDPAGVSAQAYGDMRQSRSYTGHEERRNDHSSPPRPPRAERRSLQTARPALPKPPRNEGPPGYQG